MDARPIGLTGAIAGGKSTVLALLQQMGLRTASSDSVASVVFHDPSLQQALARKLGYKVPIAPAMLREAMIRDSALRRWVNRSMHPLVGERVAEMEVDVVEVPLLFEACLQYRYREVWTVTCSPPERVRRLRLRYGPEADVEAFGGWQLNDDVKNALADVIVRTDSSSDTVLKVLRAEAARCFPGRIALP